MRKIYILGVWFVLWAASTPLYAQSDPPTCNAVQNAALSALTLECAQQPHASACLASLPVDVAFSAQDGAQPFEALGDTLPLAGIASLSPRPLSARAGEWGLVRLLPRINFSEQSLEVWLLGGVQLRNTGAAAADITPVALTVRSPQGLTVRAEPDTAAERLGVVYTGETVNSTGMLADGAWVRIALDDGQQGWASSSAFRAAELGALAVASAELLPAYGSMQSFELLPLPNTPTPDCERRAPSGVLIQTRTDAQPARIEVNTTGFTLAAGSTVFFSLNSTQQLEFGVLEGSAVVNVPANIEVLAGEGVTLQPDAVPIPSAYNYNRLALLPLQRLPREIYPALDFSTLVRPARENVNPLEGLGMNDTCTIAALLAPANLRETPAPNSRVRYVLQLGESAQPNGRTQGADGAVWWRLAEQVWVSSNAVAALGNCGTLPITPP